MLGGGERFAGEGWFGAVEVGGVADAIEEEGVFFGADALTEGQERQLLGVGLVGDPALDGETGRDGTHRGLVGAGKVYGEGGGVGRRRCGGRGGGGGDRRGGGGGGASSSSCSAGLSPARPAQFSGMAGGPGGMGSGG